MNEPGSAWLLAVIDDRNDHQNCGYEKNYASDPVEERLNFSDDRSVVCDSQEGNDGEDGRDNEADDDGPEEELLILAPVVVNRDSDIDGSDDQREQSEAPDGS